MSLEQRGGEGVQERNSQRQAGPHPEGGGSRTLGGGRPVFRALNLSRLQFFILIYPVTAYLLLHVFPSYIVFYFLGVKFLGRHHEP